ncbi:hypothetical protein [Neiella holothuriorum]|nr:hypothetical protein [Neiella holothuriorum]
MTAHVETDHSWIEVAMSAMTVGNYQLTIAKEIDHVSNNER